MDNIKYYNDSLAYDFNMFMPRSTVREEESNIVKLPKPKVKQYAARKAASKTVSASLLAVLTSVFVLAALCGNIFLRLQINEVNSKINDIKSEINVLESERTSLEMEFERRISYSNIELEAAEIGMQKMDKDQVCYITVNERNTATTRDGRFVTSEN